MGTVMRYRTHDILEPIIFAEEKWSGLLAESYKFLSTNMDFAGDRANGLKTLLVTSSGPTEGKTTTAVNLAASSAAEGKSVILVDADLRKPSLQRIFDIKKDQNGLPQVLSGSATLEEALTTTQIEGLRVIPGGPEIADATLILRSLKMEMLIKELKSRADLVIFDSPPLLSVTDAMLIAPLVDGVLLVVDARATKRDALKRAVEILQQARPAVVGTVLINVTAKDMGTGRVQDIRITASSGLSEEEIKRMVKEAEQFATEDKTRKDKAELHNQAESLVYTTEKMLADVKDSVPESDRQEVESKLAPLKEALEKEDEGAIQAATEALTKASHVLAEALYKQSAQQQAGDDGANGDASEADAAAGKTDEGDNVVDAEFEEVRDNK
ncbi:MAG: polysaccharide biosynthesis tyrosine autokinase [SAR324 cluster bacterium]|nr:polysaccharide biosynthesis tyrosine autokinase [SAR324 cluster bacterium]